jgi:predicted O-methyltransferase YrrM
MKYPLAETLQHMAADWNLDAEALIRYAAEDEILGWTYLGYWPGGSVWQVEGQVLYALVRALKPERILECGTAYGCSATHLLSALKKNRRGTMVSVTLEADDSRVPDDLRKRWTLVQGVTAQDYLDANSGFDMVFEDTDHTVPTTTAILSRLKAMPSAQTVLSHDIQHPWSGFAMREAWGAVFGEDYRAYDIEPSDCGLAMWRRHA